MAEEYIGGLKLNSKDELKNVAAVMAFANGVSARIGGDEPEECFSDDEIMESLQMFGQAPTTENIAKVRAYLEG